MTQNKQFTLDSTVYVGNLNYKKDEIGLKKLFSKYGKVQGVKLIMEPGQDRSKGIAFIKMRKSDSAQQAIKGLNGAVIDGRTLKVSLALTSDAPKKSPKTQDSSEEKTSETKKAFQSKKNKVQKGLGELFNYLNTRSK